MSEEQIFPKLERIIEVEADFNILCGDKSDPNDLTLWQLDLANAIAATSHSYSRGGVTHWNGSDRYAFREIDRGLAYFDEGKWILFPKEVQEVWSNHIADKEILT